MSYVTATPQMMTTAATDLGSIASNLSAARTAAVAPTTGIAVAAEDEVSAAVASVFSHYAVQYQELSAHAAAFHDELVQNLNASAAAYTAADALSAPLLEVSRPGAALTAASNALGVLRTDIETLLGGKVDHVSATVTGAVTPAALATPGDPVTTLVMGPSGVPIPSPEQVNQFVPKYITNAGNIIVLPTPEGLYPLTYIKDLPFDVSVARGVTILNGAIQSLAPSVTNTVNVAGYSQSAVIASEEMKLLDPLNLPYPTGTSIPSGHLNFVLVGDPSNPNGGLLTRFPGLSMPSLGLTFGTATPDNSFPTRIYTIEYDGFADFPQYPINFLSDLNAFAGIATLHGTYQDLTPLQISGATQLTNTVGPTQTQYFMIRTENLPLLAPVRAIPIIGSPIADLVQPDLRVLVDLGYGSTTQGWSPDPPNVPTPFGVIPPVGPGAIINALSTATPQGIAAFGNDVGTAVAAIPSLPNVALSNLASSVGSAGSVGATMMPTLTSVSSSPNSFIATLQAANTRIANAITSSAAAGYATLLPTADIANAMATSVPSYDVNLFLNGIGQAISGDPTGGLIYAFGAPVAADVGLATIAGGFELRVIYGAAKTIYYAIMGVPEPPPGG
ncbi:PE-PPE domain-containing protein [Mycobacterium sp.]|uniref:PE family protein n=1 Tax=Mycobacterium sp. TaxID=1785 RepID=UPI0025CD404A|nr:PE-PPE domain-containing protein [Mycobacterium sp.]MBW0015412.1 PE-PPE domain-containing protein [Mycobacterium sp.]